MALFGVWNTVEIALSPEFHGEVIRPQFAFACNTDLVPYRPLRVLVREELQNGAATKALAK